MTDQEFHEFTTKFRKAFMTPADEWDFLIMWKPNVIRFELAALEYAIARTMADPRILAHSCTVRNRLPILLEYALEHFERKRNAVEAEQRRREDAEWREREKRGEVTPSFVQMAEMRAATKRIADRLKVPSDGSDGDA